MLEKGELILTRHLATPNNRSGSIMGNVLNIDIIDDKQAINDLRKKILLVAKGWDINSNNTLVCSSPLKRCLSTSGIISDALGLSGNLLIMKELEETDMGDFSGKNTIELRKEFGPLVDQWMFNPEGFKFPNGESYSSLKDRVGKAFEKIQNEIQQNGYRYVFACTHVDLIKMAMAKVMDFSFNNRRSFVIGNGSISLLSLNDDNKWTVKGINMYP